MKVVRRGGIWLANLGNTVGSEQGGVRPVLIIQNDIGNNHSPTTIVAAITSKQNKKELPVHMYIAADRYGLIESSLILFEQIRTIDKRNLIKPIGSLSEEEMEKVDKTLRISLGIKI